MPMFHSSHNQGPDDATRLVKPLARDGFEHAAFSPPTGALRSTSIARPSSAEDLIFRLKDLMLPKDLISEEELNAVINVSRKLDVLIRALNKDDAVQFRSLSISRAKDFPLECGASAEAYAATTVAQYEHEISDFLASGGRFFGAFAEEKLIGFIRTNALTSRVHGFISTEVEDSKSVTVQGIYIAAEARGCGIEQSLLDAAKRCAELHTDVGQIATLVGGPFIRFRRFFQLNGFKFEGITHLPRINGSAPAEIYTLELHTQKK